ncbi:MAG: Asp-tRNA(Asn)/Glu-tRNA(Gln) amidotransferase subunit GatA [Acidobacteria bacterium]|nr:Asp-tRNA(Asn)/Glu-tRNA(Gln) amidotransferase subunit GatA [Acidobacteriota bacterium]
MSRDVRRGTLALRTLGGDVIDAVEKRNDELRAFVHFDAGEARAACDASHAEGALAGVPIAVKDNIATRGTLTTCASRILSSYRSPNDATVIERLAAAGAWVAGKTNLDEFAMGSSTEHSAFGPTSNPWDPTRVPGGSSGGSAAAVAAGLVPVALGSDTGGSVRQPAAFCGVTGLKPTWGRVSRSGLVAFASSLDQIGIFARSARDCARVLGVIAGHDPRDATTSIEPVPDYESALEGGIAGLSVGIVEGTWETLDDEMRVCFERSLTILRDLGVTVTHVALPSLGLSIAVYYIIANAEASANLARFDGIRYGRRAEGDHTLREGYVRSRTEGFGDEVKRRIMLGTFALSSGYYDEYYGRAQHARAMITAELRAAFGGVDLIAMPTTPTVAFRKGEKLADPLSMYLSDVYTAPANLAGIPAISVPAALSSEGLPIGLQLLGPHFAEPLLLRAAAAFESSLGVPVMVPPR